MATRMAEPVEYPLTREVADVLARVLMLDPAVSGALESHTALFGNLHELDSMAVATVLTALEDHFAVIIDDDEVTAEMFDTLGTLADFIGGKLAKTR